MSVVPLVLSAASLLFVALGAASLFYFQQPLREGQDIRQQASVSNGQVLFSSVVSSSTNYAAGTPTVIDLKYNSQGVQLSGIQIVVKVAANTETPIIGVPSNSNFQAIFQEVEQVSDGYLASVIVAPKTIGESFSSNSPTTFAQLTVPLREAGQITLSYDRSNSYATVANTIPPRDELRNPENATFTIAAAATSPSPAASANPSPSPTVNPTPTPAVTPTPVVTPTPAVTPTPVVTPTPAASANPTPSPAIPSGDDFMLTQNKTVLKFYTDDSAQTEVALADLKPNQTYRIRVQYQVQNAKKSSSTVQTPVETAFVLNGQGGSYVTDTIPYSSIANHSDGGSDTIQTKFVTQSDNTLRITVDSNRAYAETNEANNVIEFKFDADNGVGGPTGLQRTCNQYCADSRECAAGYTCFYNQCRRPDNPDSSSCAAPSTTVSNTITQSCNKGCSTNKDCANNLRCYNGACRLATNLSSLSCSPATSGVISNNSSKGSQPKPTTQPAASVAPVASVQPGASTRPSSTPLASTSPRPASSVAPTASVTPGATLDDRPEDTPSTSAVGNFFASMQARGISIPVIAVVIGLILFVLALIFAILGRTNRRPPTVATVHKDPPKTAYEDNLQQKINALKNKPIQNPTAPTPPAPVEVTKTETTEVKTPTETTSSTTTSSMMSRLKDRGVLDNMPKTDEDKPSES